MLAIIDERASIAIKDALQAHGHTLLCLPPHPALPSPVASHPDMLLFFAKDCIFCTKDYARIAARELEIISKKAHKPIVTVDASVAPVYPKDILLNAARIGGKLLCNIKHTATELLSCPDLIAIDVKQGYAKCSTVPVGDNALITADPSIARVAREKGIDVLQIRPTYIELAGYDTGFMGGASSYAPYCEIDKIYFCGKLESHPDAKSIQEFCKSHQASTVSLTEEPLADLGTVFLI